MQIYDDYAEIYDAIGQGAFAEGLARSILAQAVATPPRLLDLACGTGAASLAFAAAGSAVVGLDRAPQMLSIARAKARDRNLAATFIEADLRALGEITAAELAPASFDLITCLYDSLNYLLDDDDLTKVFTAAAALLRPSGQLIFDLNTPVEYLSWETDYQVVYDDDSYLVYNQLSYDQRSKRASGRIVWFIREIDRWWRGEELHIERAWGDDEVRAALAAAGLRLLSARTPTDAEADQHSHRVVYTALK